MVEIKLKNGQNGYDEVGEYIRRYWMHNTTETVIVSIGISNDGNIYNLINEVASPNGFDDIEFLYDWWEGEKFIRVYGIKGISRFAITDGIYTSYGPPYDDYVYICGSTHLPCSFCHPGPCSSRIDRT